MSIGAAVVFPHLTARIVGLDAEIEASARQKEGGGTDASRIDRRMEMDFSDRLPAPGNIKQVRQLDHPRDLTVMERIAGIKDALRIQGEVITAFFAKIDGEPMSAQSQAEEPPLSLSFMLNCIEAQLRENTDRLCALRDRF